MNRITTITPRKPTQRAFDDWRTTCAARSGVSSTERVEGGDVKRSTGAGSTGGRGTGRRCSGSRSGGSLIGLLGTRRSRCGTSDAPRWRAGRDQTGLAELDRHGSEGDLARVDRQHARGVNLDREPVHAARCRPKRRAVRLGPETVVPGSVAGTFEPEVLETWVRLATEMRTALVERPDVEGGAVPG